jgi:LuxR family maltose regulon positive regulatory protein
VIDYQDQYKYRTGARIYLAKGQNGDLHALSDLQRFLPRLIKVLEESSAVAYLIQAVVFQALARQAENKLDLALEEINKALDLGEQGEYIWVFIREGTPMLDLLRLANEQRRDTAYMRKLLSAAEEFIERTQKVATSKPVLAEPLTSREVDILRLLDSEDTVAQLAEKLFISVGTARTHIKRIYRKLDVHSRFEAITKARKLNLF